MSAGRVRFVALASIEQIRWGGNDNPNDLLEIGREYEVESWEPHSWHTKVILKDFPDKKFNDVSFERVLPAPSAPLEGETPETVEDALSLMGALLDYAKTYDPGPGTAATKRHAKIIAEAPEAIRRLRALSPASTEKPVAAVDHDKIALVRFVEMVRDTAIALDDSLEDYRGSQRLSNPPKHLYPSVLLIESPRRLKDAANALLQQLRAAPASVREGWLPMETAPKDGTWVILKATKTFYDGRCFVGRYHEHSFGWSPFPGLGGYSDSHFDGWAPLPNAARPLPSNEQADS